MLLESNLDDYNPEYVPDLLEKLLELGALDCYTIPIQMKKGRLGLKLSVLINLSLEESIKGFLFRNTTSLGLRKFYIDREELKREMITFDSSFGQVRIKLGYLEGRVVNKKIEFEDLKKVAKKYQLPLKYLSEEILSEYKAN